MSFKLTAIFEADEEGGYIGRLQEIPQAITQGETIEEAFQNLADIYICLERLKNPGKTYTLEEVEKMLGLDD